jgi:murein hydrolase activator
VKGRVRAAAVALAVLALAVFPGNGAAQSTEEQDLEQLRARIRGLERQIGSLRTREQTERTQLETLDLELELRNRELEIAVRTVRRLAAEHDFLEARVLDLSVRYEVQKHFIERRVRALHKMGGLSYLRLLFSARADRTALESMGMLNYLVQRDARAIDQYRAMKKALAEDRKALAERSAEVASAHELVASRQQQLEEKRREQQALVASLREQSRRSEAQLTELTEKAERLERLMKLLYDRDRVSIAGSVTQLRGALSWPVRGEVVAEFGRQRSRRFATFTINNGLSIAAEPGTEIRAIFDGTVLYSQWFKGYGNLVILDHGERVFSLYGNTRSVRVTQGDRVMAGEVVGAVAEAEEDGGGMLYFEIREDNQPVNPRVWLR